MDIQKLQEAVKNIEDDSKIKLTQLVNEKSIVKDLSIDIENVRNILFSLDEEEIRLKRTIILLQQELSQAYDNYRIAEEGINNCKDNKKISNKNKMEEQGKQTEIMVESDILRKRLLELQATMESIEGQCINKDQDIINVNKIRTSIQDEIDALTVKKEQLQDTKEILIKNIRAVELQSRLQNSKMDNISILVANKENEIKEIREIRKYSEHRDLSIREELHRCQIENENLQTLLNEYRGEAELHKNLKIEESLKKHKLKKEKTKLIHDVTRKDIETKSIKEELNKYKSLDYQLLEDKLIVSKELETMKSHTNLLESQNYNVRNF